jgi:hypothetical protein
MSLSIDCCAHPRAHPKLAPSKTDSDHPANGGSQYEARSSNEEVAVQWTERQPALGRVVGQSRDRGTKDHAGRGPDGASEERLTSAILRGRDELTSGWLAPTIGGRSRSPGLEPQGYRGGEWPRGLSLGRARHSEEKAGDEGDKAAAWHTRSLRKSTDSTPGASSERDSDRGSPSTWCGFCSSHPTSGTPVSHCPCRRFALAPSARRA